MTPMRRALGELIAATILVISALHSAADEGMWLINEPPRQILIDRYGFDPEPSWLENVQKASVRFNNGGSGSFVSPDGLILSNHHVGADALQKLSDAEHDYLKEGFLARERKDELRCLDLELNVLASIEDVTEKVNAAVRSEMAAEAAFEARRAVMAEIEKSSLDETGLRSDVVTLYQGGRYHLYRYKRYTDVRLVFAPEQQAAFFGGDPDNFEYPRYCLDMVLFRAYEDGEPAQVERFLKWNPEGADEGELVFVSGHPGRTSRGLTLAELVYERDRRMPYMLERLYNLEVVLSAYSSESQENQRRAKDYLFGIQNARKAYRGMHAGLLDPSLMARKAREERELRRAAAKDPDLRSAADAWKQIEQAQAVIGEHALRHRLLEGGHAFSGELFQIARTLLRHAQEEGKPSGERLREFRDSARESLELGLFSEKPIYKDLEQLRMADSLTWMAMKLGATNSLVGDVLAGLSPQERAAQLVLNTQVGDVAFRRKLYAGGLDAVQAANDPMIELAQLVDEEARNVRQIVEAQDELQQQAHAQIAKARFALAGERQYPDATFTLRLAFGTVEGYSQGGEKVPFETQLQGLYERAADHDFKPPFDLPERWIERKKDLDLSTPMNFVSTCDITGGNSGSPVLNRNAELVGLIFDGNIQSLVTDFIYTQEQARAVAVHSAVMIEALRNAYDAAFLADELAGVRR